MNVKKEIESIKARNARVEADKAWEVSLTRRLLLAVATYIVVVYFLIIINAENAFLAAIVPAGAYLIQQYSMPFIKNIWLKKIHKK